MQKGAAMSSFFDIFTNQFFITAISSWLIAQVFKVIINAIMTRQFDFKRLIGDGGMPSGHSATVSSLAVATALVYGFGSFEFALCAVFAIIVCHDAMGVRRETGKQAVVLNEIIDTFSSISNKKLPEENLKELVGHSPVQVTAGVLIGVCNAFIMNLIFWS